MFEEKTESFKFYSNAGRDDFIVSVLKSLNESITEEELKEISNLLE